MSTRALRKKQQPIAIPVIESSDEDEEDDSEEEVEIKQTIKPKFAMLDLSDSDNSDKDDDNNSDKEEEEEEEKPQINKKQQEKQQAKKKQAKKKQQKQQQKKKNNKQQDSEDDDILDLDSVSVNAGVIKPQLSELEIKEQGFKQLFKIDQKLLNPDNELKKLFGCKGSEIKGEKKKSAPHQHNFRKKTFYFVKPKVEWPDMMGLMVMELCNESKQTTTTTTTTTTPTKSSPKTTSPPNELINNNDTEQGINYFKIKWGETYANIQEEFYIALSTHDPMNIVEIIRNLNPYHIDSLLQLSQVCLMTADYQKAGDFVEMAVFAFECVWNHLFNPLNGNCRFEYRHDQNKSCFLSIFRYIQILGKRSCHRTALEYCKILLTLDYADPLYVRLIIDYYSIKSKQFRFLVDMHCKQQTITPTNQGKLSLLPNFSYSAALAMFMLEKEKQTTSTDQSSNVLIQQALISFPMILAPLLEKMKANFTIAKSNKIISLENEPFFKNDPLERRIDHLVSLFVERNHAIWNSPAILEWLKSNVQIVLDKVSRADPIVGELSEQIKKEYETVNQQVFDHLVLSEYSDVMDRLSPEVIEQMHQQGFQDIVPQRDPNQPQLPPQHQRRGGIGNGFQLYQQQRLQQRRQRNAQFVQQQQINQQQNNEPVLQLNPDYNQGPANPILNFIHSLLPWNDPSVQQQRNVNGQQPAPGFLDDYVDFSDEDDNEDDN